jgi:hypothetical protein
LIIWYSRTGLDTSEAKAALRQFEELQGMLAADRDRLRKKLVSSETPLAEQNAQQAREAGVKK